MIMHYSATLERGHGSCLLSSTILEIFCHDRALTVTIEKTEVIVFGKRNPVLPEFLVRLTLLQLIALLFVVYGID
jgi:hypothetical protein